MKILKTRFRRIKKIMQKKQAETLGDILQEYLRAIGADKKIKEMHAMDAWDNIVGKTIARDTLDINIKNGILTVKFRSPLIRNEVSMHKTVIIQRMNEAVGEKIISQMKVL